MALVIVVAIIAIGHWACSADEERRFAAMFPSAGPTTRAIEAAEQTIDPIAQAAQQGARVVQHTAQDGAGLDIPGAGAVALIASAIGTVLGVYNERRRGTTPLKSAITQIVQSVDAAFPNRTPEQKSALASLQDEATKQLVHIARNG